MRMKQEYYNTFTTLPKDELLQPVLFVVDMIEGFVEHGALSDTEIATITPHVQQLCEKIENRYFACDEHLENAREFQAFPQHCNVNSQEAKVIVDLRTYVNEVIPKNSTNTFFATGFQAQLPKFLEVYRDFVICGCCSDICVLQFALTLNAYFNQHNLREHRVLVVLNAIETYEAPHHDAQLFNEVAVAMMQQSGVLVVKGIEA